MATTRKHRMTTPGVSPISGVAPPAAFRWPKGVSGNPAGRPSAGAHVREWINVMVGWNVAELQSVIDDPDAPSAKVTAARQWFNARMGNGASVDRIFDRTEGTPEPSGGGVPATRNYTTEELRIIREIVATADRRAGRPVPGSN